MSTLRLAAFALVIAGACSSNDDVPAPQLGGIVPDHGPVGSIVAISGSYLCQQPPASDGGEAGFTCNSDGTVTFGATPANATSAWTDSSVMVEVPNAADGSVDVSASNGGRTSNSITFTID